MTCCCCGNRTSGKQWFNRDKGYGLCKKCLTWIKAKGDESPEEIEKSYGVEGVHCGIN